MNEDEAFLKTISNKTHADIIKNARRMMPKYKRKSTANWVIAMHLFSVGSTYGWRICKDARIDPDAYE
jgi:hypothetical protein